MVTETWNNDIIEQSMGGMGKWHLLISASIFLVKFPVAWHQLGIVFLSPSIDFNCSTPGVEDRCSNLCTNYTYDTNVFTNTITTEWNLVCDKSYLSSLSQTIFMLGILVGNMVFGTLADRFGRQKPLVIAVVIQLFCGVASAFSPWFWLFCVLRFLTAVATGGTMITSFVLLMEIIGVKWRDLLTILFQIPFNIGYLSLPLFAYFIRDWRHFQFAVSIPSVILLSYFFIMPESPRWLLAVGRTDEAIAVLEKASKMNGRSTDNIRRSVQDYYEKNLIEVSNKVSKASMLDLYRTPNIRKKTLLICFNWFVCGLAFFGVAEYVGKIGGNVFLNVAISAGLTIPGTISAIFFLKVLGRKVTLIITNTVGGLALLIIAFIPKTLSTLIIVLSSVGIFAVMASFTILYLYTGELFPTVMRNVGMGTASMVARIGSMIAPFITHLGTTQQFLPPLIFGILPLIASIMTLFLPETRGQPLPETLQDAEEFGKNTGAISLMPLNEKNNKE